MKVVIAGGNGFIGRAAAAEFKSYGDEVTVLARSQSERSARNVLWDGRTLGPWAAEIDGADVILNFAGSKIFVRWTRLNRQRIVDSRLAPTKVLGQVIARASSPPKIWANASAVGIYGDRGDELLDEGSEPGSGFLAETCKVWEEAFLNSSTPRTKKLVLRSAATFGKGGEPLSTLIKLAKAYCGGQVGNGRQFVPWIHVEDHARLVRFAIEREWEGVLNVCAPERITNCELMTCIRTRLGRPWAPPLPSLMIGILESMIRFPAEVVQFSQNVRPIRALEAGFVWRHGTLANALAALV